MEIVKELTFAEEIEHRAGEPIISVVIGGEAGPWASSGPESQVLPWGIGRKELDYIYDGGYAGDGCHNVVAWSENWVLFVGYYDGSCWVARVPRNPRPYNPSAIGGG